MAALLVAAVAMITCGSPEPAGSVSLAVIVRAGPACPVLRDPPQPGCEDRPVEGATVLVLDTQRRLVAEIITDSEGKATVGLKPGGYIVTPQPVDGLLGTPDPVELNLLGHRLIVLTYDTGIR